MWMRIRSPYNPDVLTYRDSVVYAPDRLKFEQRHLTANMANNGTFIETYILTLTILRPTIEDEGRYICARGRTVFAEYDLYIIGEKSIKRLIEVDWHKVWFSSASFYRWTRICPTASSSWRFHFTIILFRTGSTSSIDYMVLSNAEWKTYSTYVNPSNVLSSFNDLYELLVSDDRGCHDIVCELHLGNYTRHDPSIIECVADNGKSTRVSKVFHIDVFCQLDLLPPQFDGLMNSALISDPPQVITYVRALTGLRTSEIFLECSTMGNPLPVITWLDDDDQEIRPNHFYSIQKTNHSSILSFTIHPESQTKVLYYCRSNNSLGTVEKLINISGRNALSIIDLGNNRWLDLEFVNIEPKLTRKTRISTIPTTTTINKSKSSETPATQIYSALTAAHARSRTPAISPTAVFLSSNTSRVSIFDSLSSIVGFLFFLMTVYHKMTDAK